MKKLTKLQSKKIGGAGFAGGWAGERAWKLFIQIDKKIFEMSKKYDIPVDDLWKTVRERLKTTPYDGLEIIRQIEKEKSND